MKMVLQRNMVDQIKIRVKKSMVENLTEVVGIILEKNLTVVEEIILDEDLTGVEENQPTKMVVGEDPKPRAARLCSFCAYCCLRTRVPCLLVAVASLGRASAGRSPRTPRRRRSAP